MAGIRERTMVQVLLPEPFSLMHSMINIVLGYGFTHEFNAESANTKSGSLPLRGHPSLSPE
jgi:hypothetical protein